MTMGRMKALKNLLLLRCLLQLLMQRCMPLLQGRWVL